jgi:superfamily II DNA/RNA helicase
LPAILAGKDVRVQAKTGSGKTAAFGLGLLQHVDASLFQTQSLVLCPTRELADQVAGELRRLARFLPNIKILTLCGGQPLAPSAIRCSMRRILSSPRRAVARSPAKGHRIAGCAANAGDG